jgi:hypothetical protein
MVLCCVADGRSVRKYDGFFVYDCEVRAERESVCVIEL